MPRLIQQDFSEERRGEERRGVGGGREGCDGGTVGRKKEREEWEGSGRRRRRRRRRRMSQ
jgi:hypothetical protein